MTTKATTLKEYLGSLPPDRAQALGKLQQIAHSVLFPDFEEVIGYVGINYVVPLSRYPLGYHCTPGLPLPFITLANQARHMAIYHMGLYGDKNLFTWFQNTWAQEVKGKLDMGKSCIRFSNPGKIPYELITELFKKLSVDNYIKLYEENLKKG